MVSVVEAVEADLARIAEVAPDLAASALAATALRLAVELDSDSSATSKSMCANAMLAALDRLRELTPAGEANDGVDDIAEQRRKRLDRGATSAAS